MLLTKYLIILFTCGSSAYGLGEMLKWKPSPNISESLNGQKWAVIKDEFGKSHVIFLEVPQTLALFQNFNNFKKENPVNFYLYRRTERDEGLHLKIGDFDTLQKLNWKPEKLLKIVVHGYKVDYLSDGIQGMKDRILNSEDANVILVDWRDEASNSFYPVSAAVTKDIGEIVADFIGFLVETKVSLGSLHMIGHSLGAHVCGLAGMALKQKIGLVGRITGLDPALPNFAIVGNDQRLDRSDAEFVDCIHTCGGLWGFLEPICTADFYPNGGRSIQPGCHWYDFGSCSHSRAHELFTESVISNHSFAAYTCPNFIGMVSISCKNEGALMGYPASKNFQGIFYLETNDAFPFSGNKTVLMS